jgi:hypothetical protein
MHQGCGWCVASNSCYNGTANGPYNTTSLCTGGACWSFGSCIGITTLYTSIDSILANCSTLKGCYECTSVPNCDWCGRTQRCLPSIQSSKPCGANCGDNSADSCWKTDQADCPFVATCEQLTDCNSCTSVGCYWCGKNRICMETTVSVTTPKPCGYKNESCGAESEQDCWKAQPFYCPSKLIIRL